MVIKNNLGSENRNRTDIFKVMSLAVNPISLLAIIIWYSMRVSIPLLLLEREKS